MQIDNNINCSPYLLETQRTKIYQFLEDVLKKNDKEIKNFDFELQTMRKIIEIKSNNLNLEYQMGSKGSSTDNDKVISLNDVFIPCGISLGFIKTPLKDPLVPGVYEFIANQDPIYFPSATVFTYTAPGFVPQYKALELLYYSQLTVTVANDNVTNNFDTKNLRNTPRALVEGSYYYENGQYYPLTEYPILNGANTITYKFSPPPGDSASASGDPATEKTYAVLELIGFNISQLSASYNAMNCKCIK